MILDNSKDVQEEDLDWSLIQYVDQSPFYLILLRMRESSFFWVALFFFLVKP